MSINIIYFTVINRILQAVSDGYYGKRIGRQLFRDFKSSAVSRIFLAWKYRERIDGIIRLKYNSCSIPSFLHLKIEKLR